MERDGVPAVPDDRYPAGWWLTASFRLDRDPQVVQLLNDIGWLQFLGVIAPFCVFWPWFFVRTYAIQRSLHRIDDFDAAVKG